MGQRLRFSEHSLYVFKFSHKVAHKICKERSLISVGKVAWSNLQPLYQIQTQTDTYLHQNCTHSLLKCLSINFNLLLDWLDCASNGKFFLCVSAQRDPLEC